MSRVRKWLVPKDAVAKLPEADRVRPETLALWARQGLILARRWPGFRARGRWRIALERDLGEEETWHYVEVVTPKPESVAG